MTTEKRKGIEGEEKEITVWRFVDQQSSKF